MFHHMIRSCGTGSKLTKLPKVLVQQEKWVRENILAFWVIFLMLWRWWFSLSSVGSHTWVIQLKVLGIFQLLQNFCQGQNSDSNSAFWSCHYLKFSADRLILMSVYNLAEVWDQCWWLQIVAETFLQHWVCLLISFFRQVPLWTLHHFGVDYLLSTLLVLGQDTF